MFATSGDVVDTLFVTRDCSVAVDFMVSNSIVALFSTTSVVGLSVKDDDVVVSWIEAEVKTWLVVSVLFTESDCEKSVACVFRIVGAADVTCAINVCKGDVVNTLFVTRDRSVDVDFVVSGNNIVA